MLTRTLAICYITTVLVFSATTYAASKPLMVVSFNMAGETHFDKVMRDFDKASELRDADLFLLQEVAGAPDSTRSIAKDLAGKLHMQYLFRPADPIGGGQMKGLAILSRYPMRDFKLIASQAYNQLYILIEGQNCAGGDLSTRPAQAKFVSSMCISTHASTRRTGRSSCSRSLKRPTPLGCLA